MSTATTPIPPKYVPMNDAVRYTGVSKFTLRDKVAAGELRAYRVTDKPGSAYLFKLSDLDAMMKPIVPAEITAAR
ncbi:DNA-binding protein [Mycobacterium sp. ST-F2]|uniref:excisionase family DNA-binding protein n=1 Tax=Mycobacterium sp. ST-F2 TaxID=1490484 RepID=UPI00093F03AB|nr:excisionase family DNA-binding protein [Mycobacterium sp. ST-F2]OKH81162.1 DNA-binding protein [Mycobacterium sp. ST-F2]